MRSTANSCAKRKAIQRSGEFKRSPQHPGFQGVAGVGAPRCPGATRQHPSSRTTAQHRPRPGRYRPPAIGRPPPHGIMLFRTTSCTPGTCPNCNDCANDCRTCEICDPDYGCGHCRPPVLTPRIADVLHAACQIRADEYFDLVDEESAANPPRDRANSSLPTAMRDPGHDLHPEHGQSFRRPCQRPRGRRGTTPTKPRRTDRPRYRHRPSHSAPRRRGTPPDDDLPTTAYDCDFPELFEYLFEDDDHIGYLEKHIPNAPGTLDYLFEPFRDDIIRDPKRGFRR